MIFTAVFLSVVAFVLLLDGAYLYKRHRTAFLIEVLVFAALIALNFDNVFPGDGADVKVGRRIDLIILLAVARESLLSRLRSHVHRRDLTEFVRGRAIALASELPSNICPPTPSDAAKHSV